MKSKLYCKVKCVQMGQDKVSRTANYSVNKLKNNFYKDNREY